MSERRGMMRISITREEARRAGDFSRPVAIGGRRWWIWSSPMFGLFLDTEYVWAWPVEARAR